MEILPTPLKILELLGPMQGMDDVLPCGYDNCIDA